MNRKISYWKLRGSEIQTGARTLVMGVLNVTPDSFSDGGRYSDPDRAYARALELEEQGADIIDIGGESTRPGSQRIPAEEEWRRLAQILKKLRGQLRIPISVDTWRSETAERALDQGVDIINDPSGLTFDPAIARIAANGNAGLVLNHMRGQPDTWAKLPPLPDVAGTIARELEATVNRARHAGVERSRIVVDPGIGFGKRGEQNSTILAQLRRLTELDLPVLVGVSRKSFLAQQAEVDTEFATAAAVAASILNGAHIVRVHDVKRMLSVVKVADEIVRSAAVEAVPDQTERKPKRFIAKPGQGMEKPQPPRPPIAVPPTAQPDSPPAVSSETAAAPENVPPPAREPASAGRAGGGQSGFAPPKRPEFQNRRPAAEPRRFEKRKFEKPPRFERPERGSDERLKDGRKPPFRGGKPRFERDDRRPAARDEGGRPPFRRDARTSDRREGDKPAFRSGKPRFERGERRADNREEGRKPPFRADKPRFNRDNRRNDSPGEGGKPPSSGGKSGPSKRPFRKRP